MLHGFSFCQLTEIVRITILYVMLFVICFQRQLADAFVELGEMDQALDDVLGLLHETEAELLHSDSVSGDPNYCEVFVAKVQVPDSVFSYPRQITAFYKLIGLV